MLLQAGAFSDSIILNSSRGLAVTKSCSRERNVGTGPRAFFLSLRATVCTGVPPVRLGRAHVKHQRRQRVMLYYDNKAWWSLLFVVKGTVLRRCVGPACLTVISAAVAVLVNARLSASSRGFGEDGDGDLGGDVAVHQVFVTLLGLALGFLLVFRSNLSYERFWLGRCSMGKLVKEARSLARQLCFHVEGADGATEDARIDTVRLVCIFFFLVTKRLRTDDSLADLVGDPSVLAERMRRAPSTEGTDAARGQASESRSADLWSTPLARARAAIRDRRNSGRRASEGETARAPLSPRSPEPRQAQSAAGNTAPLPLNTAGERALRRGFASAALPVSLSDEATRTGPHAQAAPTPRVESFDVTRKGGVRRHTSFSRPPPGGRWRISAHEFEELAAIPHQRRPIKALGWITRRLVPLVKERRVSELRYWRMDATVDGMLEHFHACDTIASTPLPFPYAHLLIWLLVIWALVLPWVLLPLFGLWTFLTAPVLTCGFWGINEVALELEDPFGTDVNDLDLDGMGALVQLDTLMYLDITRHEPASSTPPTHPTRESSTVAVQLAPAHPPAGRRVDDRCSAKSDELDPDQLRRSSSPPAAFGRSSCAIRLPAIRSELQGHMPSPARQRGPSLAVAAAAVGAGRGRTSARFALQISPPRTPLDAYARHGRFTSTSASPPTMSTPFGPVVLPGASASASEAGLGRRTASADGTSVSSAVMDRATSSD